MKLFITFGLVLVITVCGHGGSTENKDVGDYWQDLYDEQWYDEEIAKLELDKNNWGDSKSNEDSNKNVDSPDADVDVLGQDEKTQENENISGFDESIQSSSSRENEKINEILNEEIKDFIPENQIQADNQNKNNLFDAEVSAETKENKDGLENNVPVSTENEDENSDLTNNDDKELDFNLTDTKENINPDNEADKIDDYVIEDNRLLYKNDIPVINETPDVHENENKTVDNKEEEGQQSTKEESSDIDSETDLDKDKSLQNIQSNLSSENQNVKENQEVINETKQLLDKIDSGFNDSGDENVDKIYEDLDYDLDKLFDTFDKLSQDSKDEIIKPLFDVDKPETVDNEVADYEEKYERPYNEGAILKLREDYEESLNNPDTWDDYQNEDDTQQNTENKEANGEQADINIDAFFKQLDEDLEKDADDDLVKEDILYGDDALVSNEKEVDKKNEQLTEDQESSNNKEQLTETVQAHAVENLSSAELKSKMDELLINFKDELDVNAEGFDRNVAPVHITLQIGEPVEETSPNYPDFYPTNNIVDWIFQGDGMGIEFNITDFSLNGIMGDYLLVKPGGIDHTGQDGLVFAFSLSGERRYRFLDVNRLFVRFRAHPGAPFARGFKFSVKLIGPVPELPVPIPTPTPGPEPPAETLTVYFEGLSVADFRNRSEEFRSILADMATLYINRHGVDPGDETTINVTQITRIVECNVNWPGHEPCAAVNFGIPLQYSEEKDYRLNRDELEYMWFSYSYIDPFAARLRRMGIWEYAVPNEGTVMMAWVVICLGVFLSAIMLAFAVWRWNCFEGYSRMPIYGDTDSIISDKKKDDLDLYPTPHQNLPPLYSGGNFEDRWTGTNNYEDTTRVDLGGFSNKSYVDNELLDLDSDDDVIMSLPGQSSSRNDGLTITSKHVFEV